MCFGFERMAGVKHEESRLPNQYYSATIIRHRDRARGDILIRRVPISGIRVGTHG